MNGADQASSTDARGMHRRQILGRSTAAALAGAVAVLGGRSAAAAAPLGAGADADLFNHLRRFIAADRTLRGADDGTIPLTDEQVYAAGDQWWAALDAITLTPARTVSGVRAKADITPAVMRHMRDIECDAGPEFACSLARDVMAMGV
jgi:hypothetical protein